jgi:hypothetical protein
VSHVLYLLRDITVYEANSILEKLNPNPSYLTEEIIAIDWGANTPMVSTTFRSHYRVVWDWYSFARALKIKFRGGPTSRHWYVGNLVTFVCDRILRHAKNHGVMSVALILSNYATE